MYSGPEFVLSDRYAGLLNTLFVSLLFSAGIPILLLTAAATFATMYLFDKVGPGECRPSPTVTTIAWGRLHCFAYTATRPCWTNR